MADLDHRNFKFNDGQ